MPLALPTNLNIIGVGGCGKGLVAEVLKHDWFIEEYLSRNRYTLNVMTIDTDTGQVEDDRKFCGDLMNHVADMKQNHHYTGSVTCSHYHLPDFANVSRIQDLSGQYVREAMKKSPDIDVWWMNDPEMGLPYSDLIALDPHLNDQFAGGVQRRRAISKAVFQKALLQGSGGNFPTFYQTGTYAIFVGLGGGSGSGMFLDVVRQIRKAGGVSTVWLFAILPSIEEDEKEKLNAAIALSELEYLNLTNQGLFDHVVLSSLGPTGYGGRGGSMEEVEDFDLAFPYIFVNALNFSTADRSQLTGSCREYAGFIAADAHIIEYPVENLQKLRREFLESIETFATMVEKRSAVVTAVETFISASKTEFPDVFSGQKIPLPTQEIETYKDDILNLQKFWRNHIAELLTFKTPGWIQTTIEQNIEIDAQNISNVMAYDDLFNFVRTMKNSLENNPLNTTDANDLRFYEVVKENFVLLEKIGFLYENLQTLSDQSVRLILLNLIHCETNIGNIQATVQKSLRSIREDRENIEIKIKDLREEKVKSADEWGQICTGVNTELTAVVPFISRALEIDAQMPDLEKLETTLSQSFIIFVNQLQTIITGAQQDSHPKKMSPADWNTAYLAGISNTVAQAPAVLQSSLSYITDIAADVSAYYYNLYMEQVALKQGMLARPKLDASLFKTQAKKKLDAIDTLCKKYDNFTTFNSLSMTFSVKSQFLTGSITARKNDDINLALIPLAATFQLNDKNKDTLKSIISSGTDSNDIYLSLQKAIQNILDTRGQYSTKITELEDQIKENSSREPKLTFREKFFGKALELSQNTADSRNKYQEASKTYITNVSSLPKPDNDDAAQGRETSNKYRTRLGRMNSGLLPRITDDPNLSLASILDRNGANTQIITAINDEISSLITNIIAKSRTLIDPRLMGVKQFKWTYDGAGGENTNPWGLNTSFLGIASTSADLTSSIAKDEDNNLKNILQTSFNHPIVRGAHVLYHNSTKPWEIAITLFASGNFLENIFPFNAAGGYLQSYTEKSKDNVLHHALLLQKGQYITRELFTEKTFAEIAAREANADLLDGKTPKNVVLEQYTVKEIKEAFQHDSQQ